MFKLIRPLSTRLAHTKNISKPIKIIPIATQKRFLQSPHGYTREKLGFFEGVTGVYAIPGYKLDVKPAEWRDGGYKFWFLNPSMIFILCLPLFCFIIAIWSHILWLRYDPQVVVRRDNYYPYLQIKSGESIIPMGLMWFLYPYRQGNGYYDIRNIFYHEIEDAIARRKEIDKRMGWKSSFEY